MFNHGKVWTGKDLRTLNSMLTAGQPLRRVAAHLGRSLSACRERMIIVRSAMLFNKGKDEETVKDYKFEEVK